MPSAPKKTTSPDFYAAMQADFDWLVPEHFNMAHVCSRRWAGLPDAGQRVAVVEAVLEPALQAKGAENALFAPPHLQRRYTYAQLQTAANQLSHALAQLGVQRGDRVAIVLPQCFETAVAYIAIFQLGAVAMPLSMLFGDEALAFRLQDSGAKAVIAHSSKTAALAHLRAECPELQHVIEVNEHTSNQKTNQIKPTGAVLAWNDLLEPQSAVYPCADTLATDPALLIYTSGTTGNPKGALIPHQALIGNLTGFIASQNWLGFAPQLPCPAPQKGGIATPATTPEQVVGNPPSRNRSNLVPSHAVFWSPADWAWTGGLMDALLPALYFGRPIVGYAGRFGADAAFALLQGFGVTHSFLFPTALKAMMKAYPQPGDQFALRLQAIMSAGEAVGDAVFDYCQTQLGVTVNEMFGQTEINYIVGNCAMNGRIAHGIGYLARPGSMGKGYPGHRVAVIDEAGRECAAGELGEVAVHSRTEYGGSDSNSKGSPDPVFFLGYWRNDAATAAKYDGDPANSWCRTGDLATRDADGYLWYGGRADDMFKAAGYRIGPSEIENCLVKHPAVANAAVVPKPDAERGAVVKAYVVLAAGFEGSAELVRQLQHHVKSRLAPYEYPKEIEFIDALPMTTTGKVQRRVLRLQEDARAAAKAQ